MDELTMDKKEPAQMVPVDDRKHQESEGLSEGLYDVYIPPKGLDHKITASMKTLVVRGIETMKQHIDKRWNEEVDPMQYNDFGFENSPVVPTFKYGLTQDLTADLFEQDPRNTFAHEEMLVATAKDISHALDFIHSKNIHTASFLSDDDEFEVAVKKWVQRRCPTFASCLVQPPDCPNKKGPSQGCDGHMYEWMLSPNGDLFKIMTWVLSRYDYPEIRLDMAEIMMGLILPHEHPELYRQSSSGRHHNDVTGVGVGLVEKKVMYERLFLQVFLFTIDVDPCLYENHLALCKDVLRMMRERYGVFRRNLDALVDDLNILDRMGCGSKVPKSCGPKEWASLKMKIATLGFVDSDDLDEYFFYEDFIYHLGNGDADSLLDWIEQAAPTLESSNCVQSPVSENDPYDLLGFDSRSGD